ncbi:MAG: type III-A CRISPR-associated protein Csm2 [Chitinophagales bacterium]|nr:type III-A CRISPR-associated protein Csm2 [Chitinophagales bacterium]
MKYPEKKFDPKWVNGESKIDEQVVEWLESFGGFLAKDGDDNGNDKPKALSSSQIRKFFGEVKKIEADFDRKKGEIVLLAPKLAYAVGRDYKAQMKRSESKIKEFHDEIIRGLNEVKEDKKRYSNFVNLVEGIVAYHRYKGGKVN